MKKAASWALALALLLSSCARSGPPADQGTPAPVEKPTAGQLAAAILDSQSDKGDYALLSEGDIEFYVNQLYGLEEGNVAEAAVYTAGGVDPREIAVVHLHQPPDAEGAGEGLETYRRSRVGDFFGYAPQAAALVEQGRTVTADRYAVLLICSDPDAAARTLANLLRMSDAPAPVDLPATETPVSTMDTSAFVPFDPPLAVDMSLYDDAPIVRAWETGDESGLDEKQAAILAKCREIFDETITEDMTDFRKELALYRWLTTHGEYDRTHYDPRTPLGRPDNTNPYGMLVKGYGICLGYAETFRLFMDLAGVECITVCGAAYHNDEDHAWNLVKLEGEWYCVDPTWDEGGTGRNYNYFNVTSDRLRETDHQWDYANVPEATATRFYWDGSAFFQ